MKIHIVAFVCLAFITGIAHGSELIFPNERSAYYVDEPVELAFTGLDGKATIRLIPTEPTLNPIAFVVRSPDGFASVTLPARTLAVGDYAVQIDGQDTKKVIKIRSGVHQSTMYVSQTTRRDQVRPGGGNFILGNAFNFGRFDRGQATSDPRKRISHGLQSFEQAIELDLPTICYMYWTGYVTHKPFGTEKTWAEASMGESLRVLSLHVAQRLRRMSRNVLLVGTLDEPGLSWGHTAAGGMASGFAAWDSESWYADRGARFTNDPGSLTDKQWMKYLTVRCGILAERNEQASNDLKSIWPQAKFSTDLYAPHALMDGTDPLNQRVNDIPSSHVFVDWGKPRHGVLSGLYLEKAHDPTSKIAHAMNGQLFGARVGQPAMTDAYRATMNAQLAAGLYSNWWLNTGGMTPETLASVNEPAARMGPIFKRVNSTAHDVAVLWSFTEIGMRLKDMTAREAKKKTGEQIELMIAEVPEDISTERTDDGVKITANAYTVGQNYTGTVLAAHHALSRSGYPAHIVHERVLTPKLLKRYKTLVIVGQTFQLPVLLRKQIEKWVQAGGKVVVDKSTTVKFPDASVAETTFNDWGLRWQRMFQLAKKPENFESPRQASYYNTNHFMDSIVRDNIDSVKGAMNETESQPALKTDSKFILSERHVAKGFSLVMALNVHSVLPEIDEDQAYPLYNYAPHEATLTLNHVTDKSVVYVIEGASWDKVSEVQQPTQPQTMKFEPGEMKLFLVMDAKPSLLDVSAEIEGDAIEIEASLKKVKAVVPLRVTVSDSTGRELYNICRATDADGSYEESLPIGTNLKPGKLQVRITSPVNELEAQAEVSLIGKMVFPKQNSAKVRVFDGDQIRRFVGSKPKLTILVPRDEYYEPAERLADQLKKLGVRTTVRPESEMVNKRRYPRVWNPWVKVYKAEGDANPTDKLKIDKRLTLTASSNGDVTIVDEDGKAARWNTPNTLVIIAGDGFVNWEVNKEEVFLAGCQVYFNDKRRMSVILGRPTNMKSDAAFRAKWARPWSTLKTHVGGYQYPPQLPEAYSADEHLILLGDSQSSELVRAIQAGELPLQIADDKYPGAGRSLVSFVWSPFALEKNVILIAASDAAGISAGADAVLKLVK